jgi:HD-like signal output (HDOD) protein
MDAATDTFSVEVLTSTTLDRARQIVQHAHAISPSASLLRLEQQLRQGDSNARQLAKLIDGSPALAARVLRMANSAFYAPAEPVTTLSRAVALLGDTVLRQLVLTSLIVSRRAGNRSPREALAAARLTGDAVRAAVVGKTLAQMSRSVDPDTAFAAGLLHDLGHVYLLDDVGERYASYLLDPHAHDARNAAGQLEMEIELAGTTHQDVGAVFAYEWNLPPVIARVLWDHHVPSPGSLGALIAGSDVLLRELSYPSVVDAADQQLEGDTVLAALKITRERWEERTSTVRDSFSELLSIFDVQAG